MTPARRAHIARMVRYIEHCLLARLQKRCDHPGEMVTADSLEGDYPAVAVQHCRRCGAIKRLFGRRLIRSSTCGTRLIRTCGEDE